MIKSIRELLCDQMDDNNISPLDILEACCAEDDASDVIYYSLAQLSDNEVSNAIMRIVQARNKGLESVQIDARIGAIIDAGMQYDALKMLLEHASDETLAEIKRMFPI